MNDPACPKCGASLVGLPLAECLGDYAGIARCGECGCEILVKRRAGYPAGGFEAPAVDGPLTPARKALRPEEAR
ncbi:MAG: hypothetical protein OXH70_17370 [Acidobacteria bacterium]|nr:hypothetical protein [Acidobacteriota bacterium]